ncbi:MAG TPA: chromosome segregation protein SMC, partial [Chloroflexota bacterium]|nr:chromosome segregation protein SMC [Chloroflexota bacterium]
GTVNPEAPEEYQAVSERHEFLASQMEDLRQAEKTLRKAIEELREIMEERFRASFQQVNEEFGRCFTTLFGGGTAKLVLTQPDDPLQGGVDVLATPPGRKPGSLISLSGGERSLTAVALLFALMRVNPGPFCLLDEVDAALDESNVKRFCEMVHTLADTTQFIVITHNRTTMETASALYGVSMSADSVSRVMSLKLNGHEDV